MEETMRKLSKTKPAKKAKKTATHARGKAVAGVEDAPSQCSLCGKHRVLVRCPGCGHVIAARSD
jgi:hypothetical protein